MSAPSAPFFLSLAVFRALANPRRASILKLLAERPHTPTELARRLDVSETTARQHLDVLRKSGLVARRDDGRVWAYHALTDQGRSLFAAGASSSVTSAVAALALAGLGAWLFARWSDLRPDPLPPGTIPMPIPPDPRLPWLLGGAIALIVVALALALVAVATERGRRRLRA